MLKKLLNSHDRKVSGKQMNSADIYYFHQQECFQILKNSVLFSNSKYFSKLFDKIYLINLNNNQGICSF